MGWFFIILVLAVLCYIGKIEEEKEKNIKNEEERVEKKRRIEDEQKKNLEIDKKISLDFEKISFSSFKIIHKLTEITSYRKENICSSLYMYLRVAEKANNQGELESIVNSNYFQKKLDIYYMDDYYTTRWKDWEKYQLMQVLNLKNAAANDYQAEISDYLERTRKDYLLEMKYRTIEAVTSANIAKIIFIEKKINEIDKNDELYKLVKNVSNELNDEQLIIEKLLPLFQEFYRDRLGITNNYDPLLNVAIMSILERVSNKALFTEREKELLNITEEKVEDLTELDEKMNEWLANIVNEISWFNIDKYILYKLFYLLDKSNPEIIIEALSKVESYEYGYEKLQNNIQLSKLKEKYLKGDLKVEKFEEEKRKHYNLNRVYSGSSFELYLKQIFEDLGYSVKHTGKTGDQGADLIVEKYDKKYVIQAKYYSSKLSNNPIQEVSAALKYYEANQGVVITNNYFTESAKMLAKANSIILIDGDKLEKLKTFTYTNTNQADVLQYFIEDFTDEKKSYSSVEIEDTFNDSYIDEDYSDDFDIYNFPEEDEEELFCINCGEKITKREQEENGEFCDYCVMKDIEESNRKIFDDE